MLPVLWFMTKQNKLQLLVSQPATATGCLSLTACVTDPLVYLLVYEHA